MWRAISGDGGQHVLVAVEQEAAPSPPAWLAVPGLSCLQVPTFECGAASMAFEIMFFEFPPDAAGRLACRAAPQPPGQKEQQEAAPAAQQEQQASEAAADGGSTSVRDAVRAAEAGSQKRRREADSTDWMATQLTRRFGLAGGLAWVGFLAVGVIGEQVRAVAAAVPCLDTPAELHAACAGHFLVLFFLAPCALLGPILLVVCACTLPAANVSLYIRELCVDGKAWHLWCRRKPQLSTAWLKHAAFLLASAPGAQCATLS